MGTTLNLKGEFMIDEKKPNYESAFRDIRRVLRSILDAVLNTVLVLRVILYVGATLGVWFYLQDKVLAITNLACLFVAHLLIELVSYIKRKQGEIEKIL